MEMVQPNSTPVSDHPIKISEAASKAAAVMFLRLDTAKALAGDLSAIPNVTGIVFDLFAAPATTVTLDTSPRNWIVSFPGEPYRLLRRIPVKIDRVAEADYTASFEEGNIASSGTTPQEAFQNLAVEILSVFEKFTNERNSLGPEPARQLNLFRTYIARI